LFEQRRKPPLFEALLHRGDLILERPRRTTHGGDFLTEIFPHRGFYEHGGVFSKAVETFKGGVCVSPQRFKEVA